MARQGEAWHGKARRGTAGHDFNNKGDITCE